MPAAFIPDGYTLSGILKSELYGEVLIKWRLCTHEKRQAIQAEMHRADRKAQAVTATAARSINSFLVEWDLVNPADGSMVAVTVDNIKQAHPELVEDLLGVVLGIKPPDVWMDESHANQEADEQFAAAIGEETQDNPGN